MHLLSSRHFILQSLELETFYLNLKLEEIISSPFLKRFDPSRCFIDPRLTWIYVGYIILYNMYICIYVSLSYSLSLSHPKIYTFSLCIYVSLPHSLFLSSPSLSLYLFLFSSSLFPPTLPSYSLSIASFSLPLSPPPTPTLCPFLS